MRAPPADQKKVVDVPRPLFTTDHDGRVLRVSYKPVDRLPDIVFNKVQHKVTTLQSDSSVLSKRNNTKRFSRVLMPARSEKTLTVFDGQSEPIVNLTNRFSDTKQSKFLQKSYSRREIEGLQSRMDTEYTDSIIQFKKRNQVISTSFLGPLTFKTMKL